jgi:ATP-dependent helicase HepA
MLGILIRHEQYGEGRVVANQAGSMRVRFFSHNGDQVEQEFGLDALKRGFLKRMRLEKGRACRGPDGQCVVMHLLAVSPDSLRTYQIQYENGVLVTSSEAELEPLASSEVPNPGARLASRDLDSLAWFGCREALRIAQLQNLRQGGHLVALLSARIDLHPHQAFVAGTVLDDRRRRYILADEVGLGKTVEAGVIIHDLLLAKPAARILIVCPGALTQQWLCEIYSKFGGQVFTLLELHSDCSVNWNSLSRVIVSMSQVLRSAGAELDKIDWDLVVVDECHHLLTVPSLYGFVKDLARRTPSLLLLSAIPAQRRGDEFLRLLSLLEPDRFDPERKESVHEFETLYEAQTQLNRRLQPLVIRLRGLQSGEYTITDVVRQSYRLLELPILANDSKLTKVRADLDASPQQAKSAAIKIIDHVSGRYRVYRRILRNRRQALVRDGKLEAVERLRDIRNYTPSPLETNALEAIDHLLSQAWKDAKDSTMLLTFARLMWQSLASSNCALDLLRPVLTSTPARLNTHGLDFITLGHLTGYDDWPLYKELIQIGIADLLRKDLVTDALVALANWNESQEKGARFVHLLNTLRTLPKERGSKILLFAGYPGLAEEVAFALCDEFGRGSIAEFRAEMTREAKESSAQRFQQDPRVTVLVSDETGGEGRNFQFADVVLHYDQPWQVSRVEQRIGRLDRIGRTRYRKDVTSVVVCATGTIEEALVGCYDLGFDVYRQSISGLEFSLREQEEQLTEVAITNGIEGLRSCIDGLRQAAINERTRDDNDALLDWASFQESRVQRYLSVRTRTEVEQHLEGAFVGYFQEIASKKAATRVSDKKSRDGLWKFEPDAMQVGKILPPDIGGKIIGTFRRDVAQSRLDREFFQIGNPLFDAVTQASLFHPFGRTYAVQCKSATMPPWSGFEFIFSAQPNLAILEARRDLILLVSSYFWMLPIHIFVKVDGTLEDDGSKIRILRQSFTKENKDLVWINLWKEREAALDAVFQPSEWAERVQEFGTLAEARARKMLSERLQEIVAEPRQRWETFTQQARDKATSVVMQEAQTLDLVLDAIDQWTIQLEGAGFLAVNQNLTGAR